MSNHLTVESAWSEGDFVGHRLTCGNETLLVFANDPEVFRVGDKFTPGMGEKISYVQEEIGYDENHG